MKNDIVLKQLTCSSLIVFSFNQSVMRLAWLSRLFESTVLVVGETVCGALETRSSVLLAERLHFCNSIPIQLDTLSGNFLLTTDIHYIVYI